MIDNQQVKYKISIPFSACRSFAVPVSRSSWIRGADPKNGSLAGPISGRWSVPHIPHIPAYPSYPRNPA
nr:MAG TPA: hypothetical protein [Caudoviricetes sp.]